MKVWMVEMGDCIEERWVVGVFATKELAIEGYEMEKELGSPNAQFAHLLELELIEGRPIPKWKKGEEGFPLGFVSVEDLGD